MPEGPEIRFFYETYIYPLKNKTLTNIAILSGRYIKHPKIPNFNDFQKMLPLHVIDTGVKGKNIWLIFENKYCLYFTHGMTGRWSRDSTEIHNRIQLQFNKDLLYFNDMRGFGTLTVMINENELSNKLNSLGLDVFTLKQKDKELFINALFNDKTKNKMIGKVLLEQEYVCGIGNYLRAEILWDIFISPYRLMKDVNSLEKEALFLSTLKIIKYHYQYITKHKASYYSNRDETFKVYLRDKDILNNQVIHEKLGPQTIHWVKERQK
jgi:endonuclease-8